MLFIKKKISNEQAFTLYRHGNGYSFQISSVVSKRHTWKNHIETIDTKCKEVLNLMRCVVGFDWGADSEALLLLYTEL